MTVDSANKGDNCHVGLFAGNEKAPVGSPSIQTFSESLGLDLEIGPKLGHLPVGFDPEFVDVLARSR